jgi:hypothetical protein
MAGRRFSGAERRRIAQAGGKSVTSRACSWSCNCIDRGRRPSSVAGSPAAFSGHFAGISRMTYADTAARASVARSPMSGYSRLEIPNAIPFLCAGAHCTRCRRAIRPVHAVLLFYSGPRPDACVKCLGTDREAADFAIDALADRDRDGQDRFALDPAPVSRIGRAAPTGQPSQFI